MSATVIKALIQAKKQFKELKKSAVNPAFKVNGKPAPYSSIDDVAEATAPLLDNGLYLSQQPVNINGKPWLKAILYHDSGEFLDMGEIPISTISKSEVAVNSSKKEQYPKFQNVDTTVTEDTDIDPQKMAGSVTYARRTQKCAIFDLNGETDDDGNSASGRSADNQYQSNGYKSSAPSSNNNELEAIKKTLYPIGMKAHGGNKAAFMDYLKKNKVSNTKDITDLALAKRMQKELKAMESKQEVDF